jgi:hypothetical protein
VTSPPKPPRAHDWKLLVKNIRVTCKEQEDGAAGEGHHWLTSWFDSGNMIKTSFVTAPNVPHLEVAARRDDCIMEPKEPLRLVLF